MGVTHLKLLREDSSTSLGYLGGGPDTSAKMCENIGCRVGCSEKSNSSEIISNHSDYDVVGHV